MGVFVLYLHQSKTINVCHMYERRQINNRRPLPVCLCIPGSPQQHFREGLTEVTIQSTITKNILRLISETFFPNQHRLVALGISFIIMFYIAIHAAFFLVFLYLQTFSLFEV